jgi:hypothetical protein
MESRFRPTKSGINTCPRGAMWDLRHVAVTRDETGATIEFFSLRDLFLHDEADV